MRALTPPLLVLHPDASFRARVRRSARGYEYREVGSWEELHEMLDTAPPAALLLVDPYFGTGDGRLSPALARLREDFPSVPILAALELTPERYEDLRELGELGVVQVISLHHDDTPRAIARRLASARGRPLHGLLERSLPEETSGRGRAIVAAAAEVVAVQGHARDLASALFITRRTLLRWCHDAGLPVPRELMAWMRILLAAHLLDDPGRSVLSVAHSCGYSSDSALRRVMQKFLGMSPTELRSAGAFPHASREFTRLLREARRKR